MNFDSSVLNVAIEDIVPNRSQPRLVFDDASLSDLATSIREHGIIQPLVLRKFGDKYEIVAGERRYRAAKLAGLVSVPAVIALIDDKTSAEVAVAENVQRKQLTAIEEAKSYKALLDLGYMSVDQLAGKMGVSALSLNAKLNLLNLPNEIQDGIMNNQISERHARSLLMIPDSDGQLEWYHKTIDERLTVRQLDEKLKEIYKGEMSNMNIDIEAMKQNSQDITPVQMPNNDSFSSPMDFGAPIELGEKSNGKFFNSLEKQAVSMDMTEAINPLTMGDDSPNLGFGAPAQTMSSGLSFAAVDTTSKAPELAPVQAEDPTVLPSIPAVGGMTPVMESEPTVLSASPEIDSLDSLDFEPAAPVAPMAPESLTTVAPASVEIAPAMPEDVPVASQPTLSLDDAKNKINSLINELKSAGYNIEMSNVDMADQTLFNIVLKK